MQRNHLATSETLLTCYARRSFDSGEWDTANHIPHLNGESISKKFIYPPDPTGLSVTKFDGSCLFTPFEDLTLRIEPLVGNFWYVSDE